MSRLEPKAWEYGDDHEDGTRFVTSIQCESYRNEVALYALTPNQIALLEGAEKKADDYRKVNPLGGPAVVFEAIADSIRAGDSVDMAMALFGVAWAQQAAGPASQTAEAVDSITAESQGATDEELTHAYAEGRKDEREEQKVGCEGDDGFLRIHLASETCDVCASLVAPAEAQGVREALSVQVRQADERGDEAMRRAHEAEAKLEAAHKALHVALRALDVARDTIQPLTMAQIKLHRLNPQTDAILDEAAEAIRAILAANERTK